MTIRIVCQSDKHSGDRVAVVGEARRIPDEDRYWGDVDFVLPPWEVHSRHLNSTYRKAFNQFKSETGRTGMDARAAFMELIADEFRDDVFDGGWDWPTPWPVSITDWYRLPNGDIVDELGRDQYLGENPDALPPPPSKYEFRCKFCGTNFERSALVVHELLDKWAAAGFGDLPIQAIRRA